MASLKPGASKETVAEIQAVEEMKIGGRKQTARSLTSQGNYFGLISEDHLSTVFKTKDMMFLAVAVLGGPRRRQQLRR